MRHLTLRNLSGSRVLGDYTPPTRAPWEPYLRIALRDAASYRENGTPCSLWIDYALVTLYPVLRDWS